MNKVNVVEYLKRYQQWRRGEDDRTMSEAGIEPQELGRVLDDAIKALEDNDLTAAYTAGSRSCDRFIRSLTEQRDIAMGALRHYGYGGSDYSKVARDALRQIDLLRQQAKEVSGD